MRRLELLGAAALASLLKAEPASGDPRDISDGLNTGIEFGNKPNFVSVGAQSAYSWPALRESV